jgi:cyanophycin synthetase
MHVCPSQGYRECRSTSAGYAVPARGCQPRSHVSITGTNGKTYATTRLIAHIFKQTGKTNGYTTTDGTTLVITWRNQETTLARKAPI